MQKIKEESEAGSSSSLPTSSLVSIYLYSHIIALRRQISSVQAALAQWITHPEIHRSTLYYISDCVTSTSVISISDKLIHIFYFVCRYLQVHQTFTIHFFYFTSFCFYKTKPRSNIRCSFPERSSIESILPP